MKGGAGKTAAALGLLALASCGPSGESGRGVPETKESVYRRGHELYLTMHVEEAERDLARAAAMDTSYADPLVDLGSLWYDRGTKAEGMARQEDFRKALSCLSRAEALGYRDADGYDRLCEICTSLEDGRGFLKYAKKNAERYPFDRQMYNLGVAYFGVEDWAAVVRTERDASEKFKESQYVGAFYREMALAYMKMERDQTAERTLAAGVQAVDARLAAARKSGEGGAPAAYRRMQDDKIGMLLLLRRLHTTYRETEKLAQVERQLREAGYTK